MKEEIYWCYVNTGACFTKFDFFQSELKKSNKMFVIFFVKYGLWSWYLHYFLIFLLELTLFWAICTRLVMKGFFLYVQEYNIYRERSWPLTSCWNIAVVKLWIICQVSNNLYGVIVISRETNRPLYIYIQTNIKWEQTSTYK